MANIIWAIETVSAILLTILILLHYPKGDRISGIGEYSKVLHTKKA